MKPASLVRIAGLYLVVMALYATSARAQDEGLTNWLTVVVGMSAVMTVATVAVIFALLVASRGGVAAWQAGRLGAAGQQGDALARYNQALARNPNGAEALAGRAELLAATGDTAGALADLDRAITVTPHVSKFPDPVLYRAYLGRGRLRESTGDLAGALADWAQAGRVSPGAPDPYVLRGRAAAESGDPVRARTELTTGVQLLGRALERVSDPGQRGALLNMRGLAFNLLGEYQRALADLEQSLQIQPDLVDHPLQSRRDVCASRAHRACPDRVEAGAAAQPGGGGAGPHQPGLCAAPRQPRLPGHRRRLAPRSVEVSRRPGTRP